MFEVIKNIRNLDKVLDNAYKGNNPDIIRKDKAYNTLVSIEGILKGNTIERTLGLAQIALVANATVTKKPQLLARMVVSNLQALASVKRLGFVKTQVHNLAHLGLAEVLDRNIKMVDELKGSNIIPDSTDTEVTEPLTDEEYEQIRKEFSSL